jgi:hypothetical protein
VSPPLDPTGGTALTAATMVFEILCVIAAARATRPVLRSDITDPGRPSGDI